MSNKSLGILAPFNFDPWSIYAEETVQKRQWWTRWQRSRWVWSISLPMDTSGIHLQPQTCVQNTSWEQLEGFILTCGGLHLVLHSWNWPFLFFSEKCLESRSNTILISPYILVHAFSTLFCLPGIAFQVVGMESQFWKCQNLYTVYVVWNLVVLPFPIYELVCLCLSHVYNLCK